MTFVKSWFYEKIVYPVWSIFLKAILAHLRDMGEIRLAPWVRFTPTFPYWSSLLLGRNQTSSRKTPENIRQLARTPEISARTIKSKKRKASENYINSELDYSTREKNTEYLQRPYQKMITLVYHVGWSWPPPPPPPVQMSRIIPKSHVTTDTTGYRMHSFRSISSRVKLQIIHVLFATYFSWGRICSNIPPYDQNGYNAFCDAWLRHINSELEYEYTRNDPPEYFDKPMSDCKMQNHEITTYTVVFECSSFQKGLGPFFRVKRSYDTYSATLALG